jgi:hypothetical protein
MTEVVLPFRARKVQTFSAATEIDTAKTVVWDVCIVLEVQHDATTCHGLFGVREVFRNAWTLRGPPMAA